MKKIILASSSPRRKELLELVGIPFNIHPSDVIEKMDDDLEPSQIVEQLALQKAKDVAKYYDEEIIIGADTIVVFQDQILGKPMNEEDAFRILKQLQGNPHLVYSGIALIDSKTGRSQTDHQERYSDTMYLGDSCQYRVLSESPNGKPQIFLGHSVSKVTFRPMNDEEIKAYIKTGEPLDKAGAYGVQGLGALFIEKIEGDFYSVMGLPLNLLYQMLLKVGMNPLKP